MKQITAKFNSKCAEMGTTIRRGESMIYDYSTKKCYSLKSQVAINYNATLNSNHENGTAAYIAAQDEAYFETFCQTNNI